MALAERAELVAELRLDDKFSGPAGKASRSLDKLESRASRVGKGFSTMGRGAAVALRNVATLAIGATAALGGLLALSIKEGQDALKVQQVYAKAIENSGKVSAKYVKALNEQQEALMDLGGVDDELIKSTQTQLIQMGATGAAVRKLTPLILDMSKATGRDLGTVTLAVGKALNGNIGGLSRYGVVLDKTRVKQVGPFVAVMEALEKKFGGTTAALSGNFDTRLAVLRERMANIREEVGIKLLPALTRIVDVVGKSLVPAFGKFIDRILPTVSSGLDDFARALENGGAERAINGIGDALGSVLDVMKLLAAPAKAIVGAFMSLPKELQTVIIGGLAVNKLSGGLIGKGLGQIIGGALGNRGGSPANPVFVKDVMGGAAGPGGVVGGGKGGWIGGLLKTTVALGIAAVALEKLGEQFGTFLAQRDAAQADLQARVEATNEQGFKETIANLRATSTSLRQMELYDKLIAATFAGGQITEDFVKGAERLVASAKTDFERQAALASVRGALETAKQLNLGEAIAPLTAAIENLSNPNWRPAAPKGPYGPAVPPKNAADVLKTPRFAGIVERAKEKGLDAPTVARVVAISEKTKANRAKLTAIVGDDKQKWEVGWRILKAGGEVTAQRINAVIEKTEAQQRAAVRAAAEKQAAESRRVASAQAIAARMQSVLQSITNARLATIAAKDFSPKITVPVYVSSYVSVRDMAVRQQTRATYTRVGIE